MAMGLALASGHTPPWMEPEITWCYLEDDDMPVVAPAPLPALAPPPAPAPRIDWAGICAHATALGFPIVADELAARRRRRADQRPLPYRPRRWTKGA
jgi:hypothetical protein